MVVRVIYYTIERFSFTVMTKENALSRSRSRFFRLFLAYSRLSDNGARAKNIATEIARAPLSERLEQASLFSGFLFVVCCGSASHFIIIQYSKAQFCFILFLCKKEKKVSVIVNCLSIVTSSSCNLIPSVDLGTSLAALSQYVALYNEMREIWERDLQPFLRFRVNTELFL